MTYYSVIDTNVIVSSMLKGSSVPGIVVSKALDGPIIPLINDEILEEYKRSSLSSEIWIEQRRCRYID